MGYSVDAFNVLLDRFENKYKMIVFSKETSEVAVLNFLRHSVMKGGKPVEDCIRQDMAKVKNKKLIDVVFSKLHGRDDLNVTVQQIVNEYMKDNDIHNDNDNDNDNDRTGDVSSTIRSRIVNSVDSALSFEYEAIKGDVLKNKGQGNKTCEWCGRKTTVLHKHHYPVPKRAGGTEVVNICSNCHHEFHLQETTDELRESYETIVSYLNEKAGTKFKPTTAKTKTAIHARMAEGFTLDDFRTVIDKKCDEWIGDKKMEKYLRPETLFGTKFEGYLNAKVTNGRNGANGGSASNHVPDKPKIGHYV